MKPIIKIIKFTSSLWPYYVSISILTLIYSAVALAWPVLTGTTIDLIRRENIELDTIVRLLILLAAVDIINSFLNNINGFLGDRVSAKVHQILASRYYEHLMQLPQTYFDTELTGKIISRLNRSTQQISVFINVFSNNFLQFILTTVFSLILVARYSPLVALLLATVYPIFIIMTIKTSGKWQKWQSQRNKNIDIAAGRFSESINQIKVVKSFIQENRELRHFNKYMNNFVRIGRPQSKYWHFRDVERRLVLAIIFSLVYTVIFVQAYNGKLTPGEAVTLLLLAFQIRIPVFSISFIVDNVQRVISESKDFFNVMSMKPSIHDEADASKLEVTKGHIVFDKVHFKYSDGKRVINNLSFEIPPDNVVALVGESGEGKTTITNLLLRLYDIDKGKILIDGVDISSVTQKSLRNSIGIVFQDSSLFSGTIRENIIYGKSNASDAEMVEAAKDANAHEFINKLPNGYETEIGERGMKLSGGQKQRIAIARALLKDAPILVLDEATSSLDSKSELLVQQALDKLMKGRTVIIIAHRLSTIKNVDQIITLKNGKVDEIGSPSDLANSGGIYSQLLALQNQSNEEDKIKKLKEYDIDN